MTNIPHIKVLPLPSYWFYESWMLEDILEDMIPITPVFNRDGWYFDRKAKTAWFEKDDKAYRETRDTMFSYILGLENHRRLRPAEREAIGTLLTHRICPNDLAARYCTDSEILELDRIKRDCWVLRTRVLDNA